MGNLYLMCLII